MLVSQLYYLDQALKEAGEHSVGYIPVRDVTETLTGCYAAYDLIQNWPDTSDGGQVLLLLSLVELTYLQRYSYFLRDTATRRYT